MLPEKIMQSDLLDILFENRNKNYGAYALRRSYNKTMASSITVTLFIALAFCIFQFMHHTKQKDFLTEISIIPDPKLTSVVPVRPKPETPAPKPAATHVNQDIYSKPVIVKDNDDTKMPTVDDLDKNMIANKSFVGNDQIDIVQPPSNTSAGLGTEAPQPVVVKADDTPLKWAQVMPEYPGGLEALKKFMLRNLRQPDDLEAGEKIIVLASFIVNKNGQIEQVKITTGRPDLNKEVERVINKMPSWKPGMQNGNAVAVYFNLPVTFMSEE